MVVTGQSRTRLPRARPNLRDAGRRTNPVKAPAEEPTHSPPHVPSKRPALPAVPSISPVDSSQPASFNTAKPSVLPAVSSQTGQNPVAVVSKLDSKPDDDKELLTQKRRQYTKKNNAPPDRSKMTMLDLIYWNPPGNRMKPGGENGKEVLELQKERLEEETVDDVEGAPEEDDVEEDMPGPRVRVDADGNIVLDEESLVIRRPGAKKDGSKDPVVYEKSSDVSYTSFRKARPRRLWSNKETARFYKALSVCGTDFSLMTNMIPQRTRQELKSKFKHEERMNGSLVDKATSESLQFDISGFEEDLLSDFREVLSGNEDNPARDDAANVKRRSKGHAGRGDGRAGRQKRATRGRNLRMHHTHRRPTYDFSDSEDGEECHDPEDDGSDSNSTAADASVCGSTRKRGASGCEESPNEKIASVARPDGGGFSGTADFGDEAVSDRAGLGSTPSRPDPLDVARQLLALSGDRSSVLSPGQLVFLASRTPEQEEVVHVYLVSSPPVNDREILSPVLCSMTTAGPSSGTSGFRTPNPLPDRSAPRVASARKVASVGNLPKTGNSSSSTKVQPNSPSSNAPQSSFGSKTSPAVGVANVSAGTGTLARSTGSLCPLQNLTRVTSPPGTRNSNLSVGGPCQPLQRIGSATSLQTSSQSNADVRRTAYPKVRGIERLQALAEVATRSEPSPSSRDSEAVGSGLPSVV